MVSSPRADWSDQQADRQTSAQGASVTSALHQFDKAAAQFQSDQPWTKQANWVDFDLLGEEAAKQFSAFERLGKDHLMGIRMLNGAGRPNVMYGLRSGRPEVMAIVQPGKAIGFLPAEPGAYQPQRRGGVA